VYFAISHIFIEPESAKGHNLSPDLKRLAEKIRSRFKVCAACTSSNQRAEAHGIAVAALGSDEEKLSQLIDSIVAFCEQSGFGRVTNEEALIDHIDHISQSEEND
jgi:uncharacterized protein YlxP (DUF503 family)